MATNYPNMQFNQPQGSTFQSQQFFPQPQGNIYLINNSLEMANVPTGVGVSAAICLAEGVMYLKTMQNGNPMFVGYRINPLDNKEETPKEANISQSNIDFDECLDRIEALEREINKLKQKTGSNLSELTR